MMASEPPTMRPQARRTPRESEAFAQFSAHGPYSTEPDLPV